MALAELIHINLDISAELYYLSVLGTAKFKRIAVLKPVIRYLYLITVPYLLLEHTVAVSDAAAVCTVSQSSE